jgi:hypothetical protein
MGQPFPSRNTDSERRCPGGAGPVGIAGGIHRPRRQRIKQAGGERHGVRWVSAFYLQNSWRQLSRSPVVVRRSAALQLLIRTNNARQLAISPVTVRRPRRDAPPFEAPLPRRRPAPGTIREEKAHRRRAATVFDGCVTQKPSSLAIPSASLPSSSCSSYLPSSALPV